MTISGKDYLVENMIITKDLTKTNYELKVMFYERQHTVSLLNYVKKYLLIAEANMHSGRQNMWQNFPDAWTF